MTMRKNKKPANNDYKRGYTNGIVAAVDALIEDLHDHEQLDWVEYDEGTGRSLTCKGCMMKASGFDQLAERWRFALGVKH